MLSARANCRLDHMEMVECSALEPWTVASYAIFDCVVLCCSCGNLFFLPFSFRLFFSLSLSLMEIRLGGHGHGEHTSFVVR